jgi:hypothetical protein
MSLIDYELQVERYGIKSSNLLEIFNQTQKILNIFINFIFNIFF